jgi:hypothetical protein
MDIMTGAAPNIVPAPARPQVPLPCVCTYQGAGILIDISVDYSHNLELGEQMHPDVIV